MTTAGELSTFVEGYEEWPAGIFEEFVERAIIACYETKIKKNKSVLPSDRVTDLQLKVIRQHGVYLPGLSRVFIEPDEDYGIFDIKNDPLPDRGCIGIPVSSSGSGGRKISTTPANVKFISGYYRCFYFAKVNKLGNYWYAQNPGQIYSMYQLIMTETKIIGERFFFTVSRDGIVKSCNLIGSSKKYGSQLPLPDYVEKGFTISASFMLQYIADKRFSWSIMATDGKVKIELGCKREEIKSLLYARDLPLTATGRKRPILHLVEAHQRRMKSGTDIDIAQFLRGTQDVIIDNTKFVVKPPATMQSSLPTGDKYFKK